MKLDFNNVKAMLIPEMFNREMYQRATDDKALLNIYDYQAQILRKNIERQYAQILNNNTNINDNDPFVLLKDKTRSPRYICYDNTNDKLSNAFVLLDEDFNLASLYVVRKQTNRIQKSKIRQLFANQSLDVINGSDIYQDVEKIWGDLILKKFYENLSLTHRKKKSLSDNKQKMSALYTKALELYKTSIGKEKVFQIMDYERIPEMERGAFVTLSRTKSMQIYDLIKEQIPHKLCVKQQESSKDLSFLNYFSNDIAHNIAAVVEKYQLKPYIRLVNIDGKYIETANITINNDKAKKPKFLVSDGAYAHRGLMGAFVLLDEDGQIHTINMSYIPTSKNINCEFPPVLIAQHFIDNEKQINIISDVELKILFDKQKISINNANFHYHPYKTRSFASSLFIDGICHRLCSDLLIKRILIPGSILTKHEINKYNTQKATHNLMMQKSMPERLKGENIKGEKVKKDEIYLSTPTTRIENIKSVIIEKALCDSFSETIDIRASLLIKNSDMAKIATEIKAKAIVISDSNIDYLADDLDISKLVIKNSFIGTLDNVKWESMDILFLLNAEDNVVKKCIEAKKRFPHINLKIDNEPYEPTKKIKMEI